MRCEEDHEWEVPKDPEGRDRGMFKGTIPEFA
jgi:hypothetical protein